MKKRICLCIVTWMLLQSSGQAQSGLDATTSAENKGISASLLGAVPMQPRTAVKPHRLTRVQQFECNASYTLEDCKQEMVILRKALANYRADDLGEWTWVLVRSEDWKLILLAHKFNPGIPALTLLGARTTFFEEALFAGYPERVSELIDLWHLGREGLLDLAVRHELAHALCNDINERKADRVATLLEQKKAISCKTTSALKRDQHK